MPQPLSVKIISAKSGLRSKLDGERAAGIDAVERVGDEVEHDLLDFLGVDRGDDGLAGGEFDIAVLIFAQVADHVDDALDRARADRRLWRLAGPRREKSSSFSVISLQRKASV